jgi:putative membrane protein insertion efficiency factor
MSPSVRVALVLVRAYQLLLSPFAGGACRFEPSCSAYAMDAIRIHGARRGLMLAMRRVGSCHPLGRSGFDPVPPKTGSRSAP